ncbi:MerR family transcriptional regulator [Nonomuraea sp. K274]|uniref:MerR family transcriptional regulator n=1 Tax=Nonomuraea cypriaca TaxID=1187855 RepID=A0A931F6Q0_9ACTN|nr:MerR family transcriptional regulator [Nonomuraea cypriaca]MBF8193478.1 MerR family transcriptional regulator [Nonomuraea cypriaca]
MNGDTLYSIGELARRTGLTVKAIRFYADRGIVPPTDRSPAGYRLLGVDAVARLDLVRTLRDLGVDLSTIRRVVDREISLAEVAAAHAEALAVRIRTLRQRRAVLTAVAAADRAESDPARVHRDAAAMVRGPVGAALAAGIDPVSPQAGAVVTAVTARYARTLGRPDDAGLRRRLAARLEAANDPRRERYLRLLAVINGWPPAGSLTPSLHWFLQALHAPACRLTPSPGLTGGAGTG